jgi:hypothetical protein
MSMKALNDIRDMLCEELDELARKGELGAGDLEIIHKAVSSIKNIDKIEMYDGGYSRDGEWEADMRGTYGRGSSYRGRRRDAMGRYSRTDARDHMRAQLDDMMRDADDDKTREAIRRCMEQIERA